MFTNCANEAVIGDNKKKNRRITMLKFVLTSGKKGL